MTTEQKSSRAGTARGALTSIEEAFELSLARLKRFLSVDNYVLTDKDLTFLNPHYPDKMFNTLVALYQQSRGKEATKWNWNAEDLDMPAALAAANDWDWDQDNWVKVGVRLQNICNSLKEVFKNSERKASSKDFIVTQSLRQKVFKIIAAEPPILAIDIPTPSSAGATSRPRAQTAAPTGNTSGIPAKRAPIPIAPPRTDSMFEISEATKAALGGISAAGTKTGIVQASGKSVETRATPSTHARSRSAPDLPQTDSTESAEIVRGERLPRRLPPPLKSKSIAAERPAETDNNPLALAEDVSGIQSPLSLPEEEMVHRTLESPPTNASMLPSLPPKATGEKLPPPLNVITVREKKGPPPLPAGHLPGTRPKDSATIDTVASATNTSTSKPHLADLPSTADGMTAQAAHPSAEGRSRSATTSGVRPAAPTRKAPARPSDETPPPKPAAPKRAAPRAPGSTITGTGSDTAALPLGNSTSQATNPAIFLAPPTRRASMAAGNLSAASTTSPSPGEQFGNKN